MTPPVTSGPSEADGTPQPISAETDTEHNAVAQAAAPDEQRDAADETAAVAAEHNAASPSGDAESTVEPSASRAAAQSSETRASEQEASEQEAEDASETVREPAPAAEPERPAGPTFADLGLPSDVLAGLQALGFETPSAIQAETIPLLLDGHDVVGLAQTGTGKTAAFALPILAQLDLEQSSPQALILAPTRELALQVCEAIESFAARIGGVRVLPVYGGQGYGLQLSALRRGVHIVVGTPGRIIDHLDKGTLDLGDLRFLVLDEADEMLKMGFAEDVEDILSKTPTEKQVALFSATMPAQIRRISGQYLRDPREVTVQTKTRTSANITQRYLVVSAFQKVDALTRILEVESFEGVIVFVRTKNETEELAEKLRARGFSATAINGDIPQAQRERTVTALREGKLDILVATDVAARGLDVDRISHVINFDIPTDSESYVHRIGRTGRAGRSGTSISFVTPRERRLLASIERGTRQPVTEIPLPTAEDVNVTRLARFDDAITAALQEKERLSDYRDIISHYVRHHDVPEVDVAAALAIVAQGPTPLLLDVEEDRRQRELSERQGRRERQGRDERGPRRDDWGDGGRGEREPRRSDLRPYKIEVGRRHRVEPGQIVGALANEGGLRRDEIGAIKILPEFSIVELPERLDAATLDRLSATRIKGRPIDLRPDTGRPQRGNWRGRDERGRGERDDRGRGRGERGGWDRRDDRGRGGRDRY